MSGERVHDLGGSLGGPIDKSQHDLQDWERLADAINGVLGEKGLWTSDQHRRAIESLGERYAELTYYERWAAASEMLLVEKGILTPDEIDRKAAELDERWGDG